MDANAQAVRSAGTVVPSLTASMLAPPGARPTYRLPAPVRQTRMGDRNHPMATPYLRPTVVVSGSPTPLGDEMQKWLGIAAAIAVSIVLLSACGSDERAGPANATTEVAVQADAAAFNDADIDFGQGMIPHHAQAVEMATLALERSTNPSVLDLAARIQGAQDPEIELMRGWLTAWGQQEMTSEMDGMDHSSITGMMDGAEMTALADATGAEFDVLFVDMMIRHHQGAITMAETILADGADSDVRTLAEAIIAAQQGEIEEMQNLNLAQ